MKAHTGEGERQKESDSGAKPGWSGVQQGWGGVSELNRKREQVAATIVVQPTPFTQPAADKLFRTTV